MSTNQPFSIRQWLAGLPVSSISWVFVAIGVLVLGRRRVYLIYRLGA